MKFTFTTVEAAHTVYGVVGCCTLDILYEYTFIHAADSYDDDDVA